MEESTHERDMTVPLLLVEDELRYCCCCVESNLEIAMFPSFCAPLFGLLLVA